MKEERKEKKACLLMVIFFLTAGVLFAQKKESLAIFAFTGGNASDGEAIASSLTRQVALRNVFNRTTLVTRNTIATMNFEQRFQRNSGLTDADSIFELGKQLNASHVIAGYITRLVDRNLILVSILDVESLQQIAGDYRTYRNIEEIDALLPSIAQKLAAAVPRDTGKLPGLSVPPFNILSGVDQNEAMVLAQILSCDLANAGKYAILPRTDSIEKIMEEHRRQRSGVTDQERVRLLGAGRNAQYVLSGSVQRLGQTNKFAADILNIEDGNFIDGYEKSYSNKSEGFELMAELAILLTYPPGADRDKRLLELQVGQGRPIPVSGTSLENQISWLKTNAVSNANYVIEINGNASIAPQTLTVPSGRSNVTVTLRGTGVTSAISLSSNGNLFTIGSGVTLELDTITLFGSNASLVKVSNGGTLIMNTGSTVTGNASIGVEVAKGGTFTMYGGTITDNKGSGVYNAGTFTMLGGTISGNTGNNGGSGGSGGSGQNGTSKSRGGNDGGNGGGGGRAVAGGVYNTGTFTMHGGIITGNTGGRGGNGGNGGSGGNGYGESGRGGDGGRGGNGGNGGSGGAGGVYNTGTFTMHGGTIFSNIGGNGGNGGNGGSGGARGWGGPFSSAGNSGRSGYSGNSGSNGIGGVENTGTIRISNGIIYGNGEENLGNTGNVQRGTFNAAGVFTQTGTLSTTTDTIRIENGVLR
jgi:TolB-like protein